MRDPLYWSFSVGRLFGVTIRVHYLFVVVALGLILKEAYAKDALPWTWVDAAMLMGLLFFTVFWHEMGHCFMTRQVGGEARDVLLWPLGGLANLEVPHSPRAEFLTAFGGPLINLIICLASGLALVFMLDPAYQPTWNPFWYPYRVNAEGAISLIRWDGTEVLENGLPAVMLARLFYVSWLTFLINVLLIGFPLDGGRMFMAVLWPYVGYRSAMWYAIVAGYITMAVVIIFAFMVSDSSAVMPLFLAWFIYTACTQQWQLLDHGAEESLFGYDFSQGYTSLERDLEQEEKPPPPAKKPGFWQRWLQRRAEKKRQREQEQQQAEESRMDELLEKIQRQGKQSLTDEEQRFLKRVAERYKNRQ